VFGRDHYRALFEFIDQGFCTVEVLFDRQGRAFDYRFLDVNRAFEQQTGLENAVGRTMRDLAPGHEPHWFQVYGQVALTGIPARFEQRAEALGRWYDVYAFRVGEPEARQVAILFSDITARKHAEQRLHASETRYRALAHATSNSLFRLNAAGTRLLEVYGGSAAPYPDTKQPSASWLADYVHPNDRARTLEAWRAAMARGDTFELEIRARFTGGRLALVSGAGGADSRRAGRHHGMDRLGDRHLGA
jgi:PAS domain S-box-containing protein